MFHVSRCSDASVLSRTIDVGVLVIYDDAILPVKGHRLVVANESLLIHQITLNRHQYQDLSWILKTKVIFA